MALTNEQKKHFKSIGHHLKPVLIVAENGLTEGVLAELERALNDHELIKVQFRLTERDDRRALIDELAKEGVTIDTLDIGGGFAADYRTGQSLAASDYAAAIVPLLQERVESGKLKIIHVDDVHETMAAAAE